MANISYTIDRTSASFDESVIIVTWATLANNGDVGLPVSLAYFGDKTFIVVGTFTGGPTVVIEGSNDNVNWVTLSNRQGTAMSFTAAGMNTSQDKPVWVRPRVTAGAGGAAISVQAACHRSDFPGGGR